jgi:transposase
MEEQMMPRISPYQIVLSDEERAVLESAARKYTSSYYEVIRAKTILLAAQGIENKEIGARLNLPRQIVSKWRKRFFEERLPGLEDRPRRGRPRAFPPSGGHGGQSLGV